MLRRFVSALAHTWVAVLVSAVVAAAVVTTYLILLLVILEAEHMVYDDVAFAQAAYILLLFGICGGGVYGYITRRP